MKIAEIGARTPALIAQLMEVWKASVTATHEFLTAVEIAAIQNYVPQALNEVPHLIVAENEAALPAAFMGINGQKLEMLFVSPAVRGHGWGKALLAYGMEHYGVDELAVNEQNPLAKGFYEHMGFHVFKRTHVDEQGRPYPLLYMRRGDSVVTERNEQWRRRIQENGADFVYFVDASVLPGEISNGYSCAILFGKALSKAYIRTMRAGLKPERKEFANTERKMDVLAVKVAGWLEAEGYPSIGKLKTGLLPHKTVALRAGLGFIGKNNLLVTPEYGCAQLLGKVLTTAPFVTMSRPISVPQCGDCSICVEVCPTEALLGKSWSITTTREEIMTRKRCTLCLKCMVCCPHTQAYSG